MAQNNITLDLKTEGLDEFRQTLQELIRTLDEFRDLMRQLGLGAGAGTGGTPGVPPNPLVTPVGALANVQQAIQAAQNAVASGTDPMLVLPGAPTSGAGGPNLTPTAGTIQATNLIVQTQNMAVRAPIVSIQTQNINVQGAAVAAAQPPPPQPQPQPQSQPQPQPQPQAQPLPTLQDYLAQRRLLQSAQEYIRDPFALQFASMVQAGIPQFGRFGQVFQTGMHLIRRWFDDYDEFFDPSGQLTRVGRDVFDAYLRHGLTARQAFWMRLTGRGRLVQALQAGEQAYEEELARQQAQGVTGDAALMAALGAGRAAYGAALAGGATAAGAVAAATGIALGVLATLGISSATIAGLRQISETYFRGELLGTGGLTTSVAVAFGRALERQLFGWVPVLGEYIQARQELAIAREMAYGAGAALGFQVPRTRLYRPGTMTTPGVDTDILTAADYQLLTELGLRGVAPRTMTNIGAALVEDALAIEELLPGVENQAIRNRILQLRRDARWRLLQSPELYLGLRQAGLGLESLGTNRALERAARDIAALQLFTSGNVDASLFPFLILQLQQGGTSVVNASLQALIEQMRFAFAARQEASGIAQRVGAEIALYQVLPGASIEMTMRGLALQERAMLEQALRTESMAERLARGLNVSPFVVEQLRTQIAQEYAQYYRAMRQREEFQGTVVQAFGRLGVSEATLGMRLGILGAPAEAVEGTIERVTAQVRALEEQIRYLESRRAVTELERVEIRAQIAQLRTQILDALMGAPPMTAAMQTAITLGQRVVQLAQTAFVPLEQVLGGYGQIFQTAQQRMRMLEDYRAQMMSRGLWNAAMEQQFQQEYSQALFQAQQAGAGAEQYQIGLVQARASRIAAQATLGVEIARGIGAPALSAAIQEQFAGVAESIRRQIETLRGRQFIGEIGGEQVTAEIARLQAQMIQAAVQSAVLPADYRYETQMGLLRTGTQIMRTTFAQWGDIRGVISTQLRMVGQRLRALDEHYQRLLPTLPEEARAAAENAYMQQRNALIMEAVGLQQELEQGWLDRLISQSFGMGGNYDLVAAAFTRREAALFYEIAPAPFGGTREQTRYWRETLPMLYASLLGRVGTPEGMLETAMAQGQYNLNIRILIEREGNPIVDGGTTTINLNQQTQGFNTITVRTGVNAQ